MYNVVYYFLAVTMNLMNLIQSLNMSLTLNITCMYIPNLNYYQ